MTSFFSVAKLFSALAFFPFIGWLFPLYLKRGSVIDQKNAKVSLLISCSVILISVLLTFIDFFTPSTYIFVFFIISTLQYILLTSYLLFSLIAISLTCLNKKIFLPYFSNLADSLNI